MACTIFFLRMINGVLVLVCDTFSLTPWILSRRVDHYIIGFLFSDIFDWGIKFFWFILRISAGTNTYSTYIHPSTHDISPSGRFSTL